MSSSYIGLLPSQAQGIVLPPNSHLTLAFMEETNWEETVETLESLIRSKVLTWDTIKKQIISGSARFTTPKNDALVVLIDGTKEFYNIRKALVDELSKKGVKIQRQHGWVPHITLDYVEHGVDAKALSVSGLVQFNGLRFKEKDSGRIKEWKTTE